MNLFFQVPQTTRADRLVQGIGQITSATDFRHTQSPGPINLGPVGQTSAVNLLPERFLGQEAKKAVAPTLPVELHIAFDRYQRHSECTSYLRLSRIAIDDQLSTKKPEVARALFSWTNTGRWPLK